MPLQKPLEITSNKQDQASQTEIFETAAAMAMEDAKFFEQRAIIKYASGGRFNLACMYVLDCLISTWTVHLFTQ